MSTEELKQIVAELAKENREAARRIQETDRQMQETRKQMKESSQETDRKMQETGRFLKEIGKQIGGLNSKWGSYTEGLALPSMTELLAKQFDIDTICPNALKRKKKEIMEIDVLGFANGSVNRVCIVEVKSHIREDALEQLEKTLERFAYFYPEHKGKELIAFLAGVSVSNEVAKKVIEKGYYLASTAHDIFKLKVPKGFKPKKMRV